VTSQPAPRRATSRYIKIPNYTIYDTQHLNGTAHVGTAIIIKTGIKHHLHEHYNLDHLQATSVVIEDWIGLLTLAAVYCPPKHNIKTAVSELLRYPWTIFGRRQLQRQASSMGLPPNYPQKARIIQSHAGGTTVTSQQAQQHTRLPTDEFPTLISG
jgi:hypothetical protein